ncbi:dihydroorotate dehydrogenase [Mollicutes bacterium LVI A0078]|nr:dihydroorotate dehydrogenase [Mollicutes bacterium LVI A0075]WOO91185.1 dihydroorotate dehydrogenase [Mollicutes bacterium LVI A0078]
MLMNEKLQLIEENLHRLNVKLGDIELPNPVMPASGCCAFGHELNNFYPINKLGAIMIKSTTDVARDGNPNHRIYETSNGMLNSIGLQNPGVDVVIDEHITWLDSIGANTIVNLAGSDTESYVNVARELEARAKDKVTAIELNVSCPNVKHGGIQFGSDPQTLKNLVNEITKVTTIPVFVKLSPNVTSIKEMAMAVDETDAYGITMINTLVGMAIDYRTGKPIIANKIAGYSGPAIKPVALKQIYEVRQVTNKPIIGMGGIESATDIIEFLSVGSDAIAIGTANFNNPTICIDVLVDLLAIMDEMGIDHIDEFKGRAHV